MDRFMYRYGQTVYKNLCQIWFTTVHYIGQTLMHVPIILISGSIICRHASFLKYS